MTDALFAMVLAAVTVVYGRQTYADDYRAAGWPSFGAAAIALSMLVNLPLAVRTRAPLTAFALSCAGLLAYTLAGFEPSVNLWATLLACYTVVLRVGGRRAGLVAAATSGTWVVCGLAAGLSGLLAVAQTVIAVGLVWVFAAGQRQLALRNAQLRLMAERLRLEQELRAEHAAMAERVRIARELHDVVAHHLSALAMQAGVAQYLFASDPQAALAAVGQVGTTSREALDEMRGLLRVLRVPSATQPEEEAEGEPMHPAPGLDQLEGLARRVRAAGVEVEVRVAGERVPLPPGIELCAFRIVQEALTNTLKHAGRPAAVTVELDHRPHALAGRIVDDGPGRPGGADAAAGGPGIPGTGFGLIGVGERVRLYGGQVQAGPRAEGGFEVAFTLPLTGPGLRAEGDAELSERGTWKI
ncbi:sensor histidine kinase [Kitasatospora viridis]|uniref:sensor histidine kinase n=1 Tax=Kitasatospora viridis TaxID=281105 RepID=UPI0014784048|nr:histidine kinase [Kitasatospora viridis]